MPAPATYLDTFLMFVQLKDVETRAEMVKEGSKGKRKQPLTVIESHPGGGCKTKVSTWCLCRVLIVHSYRTYMLA